MRARATAASLALLAAACSGDISDGVVPDLLPAADLAAIPTLHFTSFQDDTQPDLFGITGLGGGDLFAVGQWSWILHTTNGGVTWSQVNGLYDPHKPTLPTLRAVSGVKALVITVGDAGTILSSGDDGATWITQKSGTMSNLLAISVTSATDAWAAGASGTLLHSSDGGVTWTAVTSSTTSDLRALFAVGGHVYAVGTGGVGLRVDGAMPVAGTLGTTSDLDALWGQSSAMTTELFSTGAKGTLRHTSDGKTWSAATSGTTEDIVGIWGSSAKEVFAGTSGGKFLHTLDDGATWSLTDPGMSGITGTSLWASAGRNVYLAAQRGFILHGSFQ